MLRLFYYSLTLGAAIWPLPVEMRIERVLCFTQELIVRRWGAKSRIGQWARGIYYMILSIAVVKMIYGYSDQVEILAIPVTVILTIIIARRFKSRKLGFIIRNGCEHSICVISVAVLIFWSIQLGAGVQNFGIEFPILGALAGHTLVNLYFGREDDKRRQWNAVGFAGGMFVIGMVWGLVIWP